MRTKGQLSHEARERQIERQRAKWLWEWNARDWIKAESYRRVKKWRHAHPETAKEQDSAYKKKRRRQMARAVIPDNFMFYLTATLGTHCLACGHPGVVADHVRPLSRGGKHEFGNLQVLCTRCNSAKGQSFKDYRLESRRQILEALDTVSKATNLDSCAASPTSP